MIYEGQRLIEAEAADGSVALAVTRAHRKGERFVLARTADDKRVPIFVTGARRIGARLVGAKTADGKRVAVKFMPDWVPVVDEPKVWRGTAVSATGQYMMAVEQNRLWRSTNYGETFSLAFTAPESATFSGADRDYSLFDCYMNATGRYCATIPINWFFGEDSGTRPYQTWFYTSDDFGATWTLHTIATNAVIYGIAISATGQYMTACRLNASPRYSHDYGVTWATATVNAGATTGSDSCAERNGVGMSTDGETQYVVNRGDAAGTAQVIKSTDFGATWANLHQWTESPPVGRTTEAAPMAVSDDGAKIVFVDPNTKGHYSADSGSTWGDFATGAGPNRMEYMTASSDFGYIGTGGSLYGTVSAERLATMLRTASLDFDDWATARAGSQDQIIFPYDDAQLTGLSMSANGIYWLAATSLPTAGAGLLYLSRDFGRKGDFIELPEP